MYTLQVKTSKMRYFRPFSLSLGCIAVVTSGYLPSTAETKEEAEKLLNELNTWVIYDLEELVTALKALEKDE